jgi:hypothetical protein
MTASMTRRYRVEYVWRGALCLAGQTDEGAEAIRIAQRLRFQPAIRRERCPVIVTDLDAGRLTEDDWHLADPPHGVESHGVE